ncbi:MAG: MarR family transcriptional regulator, temperature-dependent positive regulator of motility [Mycobacterium sp.]|jgi:DNA-binding MarR family transcriptional regulator|nr:MarR family transcriptional regulator, temperature-dependent positive regulator of motility [Mycobacterium sp.]MDT5239662.1 MarR family transcriptional regulator, temperature-dependent positive regulator of motility [Mycobacterium sp.]MDT5288023.1 MarR family transcriptional regulator, temperature-dependent positive regulator of motility [Mycobacterium sp.]MDT5362510.1 MarR family transcriptional regulator, temperature-dependent positive regulator of motility [Mycobacterium sp.]
MSVEDAAKIWSLNYRVLLSVIASVETDVTALGVDSKELFLLAEIDEHPYPAELAATLSMPKATVTLYLKRLEAAGFVSREIDPADLRRHRLQLTPAGRRATNDGLALLSDAFGKRLERLTRVQQRELKDLLEQIL